MGTPGANAEVSVLREVSFTKLTHEITQVVYKDLHALLDSMSEMESAERRTKLLDYTARARHRVIRLLVAVRWHMECSAFHSSAGSLAHVANTRSFNYALNADRLWHSVFTTLRGAAAQPSAVAFAGELLGPGMTPFRLPRFIELSIEVDTRKRPAEDGAEDKYMPPVKRGSRRKFNETEPEMRVRLETKFAVRRALPSGIVIVNWNADPSGVSVRIGHPDAWHADLILSSPDSEEACFVILDFKVLVRTHIDAVGPIRRINPLDGEPLPMTRDHYNYLRNMMQDRMAWAAHDAKPLDVGIAVSRDKSEHKEKTTSDAEQSNKMEVELELGLNDKSKDPTSSALAEKGKTSSATAPALKEGVSRSSASLRCFCMIMTREICTTLAMDYIREQAAQLAVHPAWRKSKLSVRGIGSKAGPLVPVTVEYWKESPFPSAVTVSAPKDEAYPVSAWSDIAGSPNQVVDVSHSPPLPISKNPVTLHLRRVDVESLCLDSARQRAQHILAQINHSCRMKTTAITRSALAKHGAAMESLVLDIGKSGFGLHLSMSLRTGGFRILIRGGTNFAVQSRADKSVRLRRALWKGERHIPGGIVGIEHALLNIIDLLMEALQVSLCVRQTAMADEGALPFWPPGAAAVEGRQLRGAARCAPSMGINPPLLSIEKTKPVRFLAMQSWLPTSDHSAISANVPATKRNRTSPVNFTTSPDGFVFVQGKVPHDLSRRIDSEQEAVCLAGNGARLAQLRYATDMRFRRDRLLRELQINAIAVAQTPDYELRTSERTPLTLRASPLPVICADLVLRGECNWLVEVKLDEDIFDNESAVHVPGVRYAKSSRTLTFAYSVVDAPTVRRFGEDLMRARGTGALANEAKTGASTIVAVKAVTPSAIVAEGMGTVITIKARSEIGAKVAIGARNFQFEVVLRRKNVLSSQRMMTMLAEVLNENKLNAGERLLPLLERAIPVIAAAERAAVASPSSNVKLRTALRFAVEFKIGEKRCALDIDARPGLGRVVVADLARIRELAKAAGRERNPSTEILADIPSWDAMLNKLASRNSGVAVHQGAAVLVKAKVLEMVVELIVGLGNGGG